jgi:hypothetical protein
MRTRPEMFYTHLISSLPTGPPPFFSPIGNERLYLIFVAAQTDLPPCQEYYIQKLYL